MNMTIATPLNLTGARARRMSAAPDIDADLRRARWLANWLDAKFHIAGIRFGLDGIVGVIPVVGDTLGLLAGLYPLYLARRHRLSRATRARMLGNLLVEWLIGMIPFVGDAFDIAFKANLRNVRVLERALTALGTTHR